MKSYLTIVVNVHSSCNSKKIQVINEIIKRDTAVKKYMYRMLKNGKILSKGEMDKLFITTSQRKKVKCDLKKQFQILSREYQEIRDNVYELLKSTRKGKSEVINYVESSTRRMRHQQFKNGKYTAGTCRILQDPTNSLSKTWLCINNRLNGVSNIRVPLEENPYLNKFFNKYQVNYNSIRTITLTKKMNVISVNLTFSILSQRTNQINYAQVTSHKGKSTTLTELEQMIPKPNKDNLVILGLDPGLRTPYTGCFVDTNFRLKYDSVRYYYIPVYQRKIDIIDKQISKKQRNLYQTRNANKLLQNPDFLNRLSKIRNSLSKLRSKRNKIRQEAEIELSKLICQEVELWQNKGWDVKVVVGYPQYVNTFSSKNKVKSKTLRRRTSRWNYKSRPEIMQNVFESFGMDNVFPLSEEYSSKTCWKCGITEFRKFKSQKKQKLWGKVFRHAGYFKCQHCGWQGNSDLNGAINIAKKYILTQINRPKISVLTQHKKRKTWYLSQQRSYINQFKRAKSSMSNVKSMKLKYIAKSISWNSLIKRKMLNTLYWCEYPTDHLKSFKWITTRPHLSVPSYPELYDNSVLCPI